MVFRFMRFYHTGFRETAFDIPVPAFLRGHALIGALGAEEMMGKLQVYHTGDAKALWSRLAELAGAAEGVKVAKRWTEKDVDRLLLGLTAKGFGKNVVSKS